MKQNVESVICNGNTYHSLIKKHSTFIDLENKAIRVTVLFTPWPSSVSENVEFALSNISNFLI